MKTSHSNKVSRLTAMCSKWANRGLLAALAAAFAVSSTCAQTVIMRSVPLRFTLPKGVFGSQTNTITVTTAGIVEDGINTVNLSVGGVGAIPGLSATLITTNTFTNNGTFTASLIVSNDISVASGYYEITLDATGVASYRLPVPVECAHIWNGLNYTNAVSTNFSSAGNWAGSSAPGASDRVVFKNGGGQDVVRTNIIVSSDQSVQSIRFATDTAANSFHTMELQNGANLRVTGDGFSFGLLRDRKTTTGNYRPNVQIYGNGTLSVTNAGAKIGVFADNHSSGNGAILDMRNLNNFVADVIMFSMGDYRQYPNYYTNGSVGQGATDITFPGKFTQGVYLAKTNLIKCSWVDPNNYNDPAFHDYAINTVADETAGTSTTIRFSLGISNAFFIDSINWSGNGAQGSGNVYGFNAGNSYALFRGITGLSSRMAVWSQGDVAGPGTASSSCRATVDFSGGQVDALVDRFYLGRYRTNITSSTIDPRLTIGGTNLGTIFDINTAYIGCQDVINLGANTSLHGPAAFLTVNSNATVKVNNTLYLGYTVAPSSGAPNFAEFCRGSVTINGGGTVMANTIVSGGTTKVSTNNSITVNTGGKLIVTNTIGAADARIAVMTLSGNAPDVTLRGVKVGETNIFVQKFAAASSGGVKYIRIPSIAGVSSYPVTIPLISYLENSPAFNGLAIIPPAGVYVKTLVDNTANQTIDVTFSDEPPTVVVWRGNINNIWDLTTKNWVTQVGGISTNYSDGFSVVFDNTVGAGPTSIDISAAVTPGQVAAAIGVVVSNQSYTFNSGTILGGATILKTGTGNLTFNVSASSAGINMNSGVLSGSGSIGSVNLDSGTTMTAFTGSINGGLIASNATVTVAGPVSGGLTLRAGSLANSSTINGSVSLASGTTLDNRVGATMNVNLPWTITTNTTLINNGDIFHFGSTGGNQAMSVDGILKGRGRIIQNGFQASSDVRVTLRAGGQLMIGNNANEITNMTIAVRLDTVAGSLMTFDVDNTGGTVVANDKIILNASANGFGKINFGNGNELGGKLLVNKVTGPSFNGATTILITDQTSNPPDNTQPAIPQIIPAPAPGLIWNTAEVISNLTLTVTATPFMTNSITVATNGSMSYVFEWPAENRGWRLERQTNSLAVGLESQSTNWTTLVTTLGGTNVLYYPDITNNPGVAYMRSVQTITTTNAPTTFYRLSYP